jgi:membrane protein YdbS with pleckstrin-like domain
MTPMIDEECDVDDTRRRLPDPAPEDLVPEESVSGDGDGRPAAPRLPAIADGVERPVDPGWVSATRITSSIAAFVFGVPVLGGGIVAAVFSDRLGAVAAVALDLAVLAIVGFLVWSAFVWPRIQYRHLRYRVDPTGLAIRRGVLWREDVRVPRSRVQHTDVNQGPIERSFGLSTLIVFTAGTQHAKVSLDGLRDETARAIRDFLVDGGDEDGV